jgi:hypothetical protein
MSVATPEVIYARAIALTLARVTPELRREKLAAYLSLGIPPRGSVAVTSEAETILATFEKLRAGVPAHSLIPKKELPRSCREVSLNRKAKQRLRQAAIKRWRELRAAKV